MTDFRPLVAVFLGSFLLTEGNALGQAKKAGQFSSIARKSDAEAELARIRADVIEKMKESRAGAEKLLRLREEEVARLTDEYKKRLEFYHQGLIARIDVYRVERLLAEAMVRVEKDKGWISEQDIAITEASMKDQLLRLPGLAIGGYSESSSLIRYNGGGVWSIADALKVQTFFSQTFGRVLPISAYGQTATHDRLQFDHRNAIDVALHPDSHEGRSLISYLRQSGIPFIAFRHAVAGASTGAHIHIGKPSPSMRSLTAR